MSKIRISINYIASGQPRAYADSRTITSVQFERTDPMKHGADLLFEPDYMDASTARIKLDRFGILKKDLPDAKDRKHGLDSHLVYLKPIGPKRAGDVMKYPMGDPDREVSDVWEFYICQPYCD